MQRHAHAVVLRDRCFDSHGFAEFRHGFVLAGDLQHRTAVTGLFNAVVAKAELLEQVHARLLEPADVVRVVDDAHAVGFVVLDFVFVVNHLKTFFQLEISSAN